MTVQGRLADSTGAPQTPGAYGFTFRLFDAELGGTQIWPDNGSNGENQIIVLGDDGLWTAALGADSALGEAVFQDTTRWLEVTVDNFGGSVETLPRTKLNTSPYTFRAATVQTVDGATGGTLTGSLDVDNVLEVVKPGSFVGVNRSNKVTGSDYFGVRSPTGPGAYGGMYLDTQDSTGRPFYGYATNGFARMWHYYHGLTRTWHLWSGGSNRLSVTDSGNVGIGTTAPAVRLEVTDGIILDSSTQVLGAGLVNGWNLDGVARTTFSAGRIGLMGQASTNSGSFKIGVAASVSNNTGTGAAYGVYSDVIGGGSGSLYSGYFIGGDFVVGSPATAGNASVQLPNNAISDSEIEDEPGLSQSYQNSVSAGAPGLFVLDSVEINCPTDGYVIVTGHIGWVNVTHTTGTSTELQLSINKSPVASLPEGIAVWRLQSSHPSTGVRAVPLHSTRVYSETAGTQKYYLVYNYQAGSGSASAARVSLRALFVPTLYGTATLSESAVGGGNSQSGADVRTDGSEPLPQLRTRTITVADHEAAIDAELAELRARLEALESVTLPSSSEER